MPRLIVTLIPKYQPILDDTRIHHRFKPRLFRDFAHPMFDSERPAALRQSKSIVHFDFFF
jgi:hypothetical protein